LPHNRAYIDYGLAVIMGYSLIKNIGFFFVASERGSESWLRLGLTVIERIVVSAFGHHLGGHTLRLMALVLIDLVVVSVTVMLLQAEYIS
jgi:hypothetical protein